MLPLSNLLGLGWGDGVIMEEEAGIKPQLSASKSSAFSITPWLPLAKKKKRLGEKHFLVGICMKSLVQLPPVRFQARDNYWQTSSQHFLCGKLFSWPHYWWPLVSGEGAFQLSIIGYLLSVSSFSMTLTFWKRWWCSSGRKKDEFISSHTSNLVVLVGDVLRQSFLLKPKKWGITE